MHSTTRAGVRASAVEQASAIETKPSGHRHSDEADESDQHAEERDASRPNGAPVVVLLDVPHVAIDHLAIDQRVRLRAAHGRRERPQP